VIDVKNAMLAMAIRIDRAICFRGCFGRAIAIGDRRSRMGRSVTLTIARIRSNWTGLMTSSATSCLPIRSRPTNSTLDAISQATARMLSDELERAFSTRRPRP